jgi:ABC-2 type transport system ATP-binding protein
MILNFEHVSKSYGAVRALDDVSFAVDREEIVAVLGPNGAGKTTAMEIVLGLRKPDAGSVRLFGTPPDVTSVRARLGSTPQESGFPDTLRVDEILAFASAHYERPEEPAATLAAFGLSELAGRRAGALSGGESRRLALALAFVGRPELVVLDEPTTGLDVESRRRLWDVVREEGRGRSILFTTHYLEEAQELATRVVVIDRGHLLFDGSVDALRQRFGGRRLSYVGDPLDPASFHLPVASVRTNGHVVVTTEDTDAYVRALVQAGIAFTDLEISRATLEDAFLSITGGSK